MTQIYATGSCLPEGPGCSPDFGRFWVRGGQAFFNDGDVVDLVGKPLGWRCHFEFIHEDDYSDPLVRHRLGLRKLTEDEMTKCWR